LKVKELIETLKGFDGELQVGLLNHEFQTFEILSDVELRDIKLSENWMQRDDKSLGKKFIGIS